MFEPPALRPRRLVTPRKSGTEDQTTAQPTLDPQLTATPTYLTTPMVGTVASSSSTPAPASPAPAPATSPGPSPAEAPSVSESGAPPTPSTASGDTAAPTPTPASATQPSGAATPAAAPGTTTSTAPGPTPSAAPAPTPASAGAPQPSSSTAHLAAQPRTAAAPQATAATHAATPAARAAPGRARAGGAAATAERDDDEADIVEDIGDTQAASQLVQEWFAEAPVMFDDAPLDASFEAPTQIALRVTPPPAPRPEEGAADQAIGPDEAARQAGEMYARGAAQAHDAHDALINDANRAARRIFDQASDAIAKLDFQIQPTLDELVTTLTFNRRELDGAVDAANAHIEAEARTARRRAGGVAASGRARVTATAQHAVNVELPAVRTELRGDFTSLYMRVADAIAKSGTDTRTELQKPSKHQEMIGKPEYVAGGPVQEDAANEAARAEIPPRMNHLGDTIQRSANQTATPTRGRLDTQPTGGGQSMGQGIDNFINSMRDNITGNAASAAVSAAQRALPTGGAMGALVEGAKAFVNTASTGSLEQRGHTAINRSHGEAMRSLASQARAARKAVLHAKRNGQRMFVTQRAGALTRLAGVRRMRIEALKEVANQSAKALRGGARSATTFYSDAARRFGDTLKRAAERGPSALTQTMREGAPTVTRAITEGQRVQTGRLNQVEQGAQTQVGRLSASTSVDAQGAAADFGRNMNDIGAQLRTQTDDAATAHSRHFNEVTRGISQTTQGFTQPLRVMFKAAITDTQKNLKPILKAETTALEGMQKRAEDNNKAVVTDPNTQLGERLRGAKRERDDNLGRRANAMNGAFGTLNLQEDLLMEQSRGVTALGGASILDKIPSLWGRIVYEHDRTIGGLDDDEFNAIKNYLAGRTAEGAKYELRTTVHWYGNEGGRATKIMDEIGGEARRQLTASGDWPALAADVRDGLRGTDRNVFDALAIDRPALARAYRMIEGIDRARESNNSDALFTAVTPYTGEVIRDGRVVSAEEQLQETQREFAVARGLVAAPNDISQADAARALADYATRPVTVLVNEGDVEHPNYVERTYTLSGPDAMLARALATGGPNSEDARAARMLRESERTGKPNLEQLENAVVDPRLNPALTPELTDQQRADARQQQDQLFLRYADMARQAGVQVQGTTPREIREFLAGRLGARYGDSAEERQGARYAGSIVLEDRPNPVAAMRYAMMGSGTKMDLLRRTFGRLSREDVRQLEKDYEHETHRSLVGDLGVYGHGPGEVSGDERLEIEVAMMGVPRTDRERAEVALYKNLQQQRETGVAGRAALRGSEDERMMLGAEANLRRTMGGTVDYDEYGRPVSTGGAFDQRGRYTGPNDTAFLLAVNRATHTAENYAAAIDRLASTITTIIAIVGAVVAAVLTVVTAGAAGPLMIAALSFGLASMGANALIRGGRYGWEEALTDLGMVGVQVLTAGLGAQLGAAAKGANAAATAARAGGPAVARTGLMRLFTGNRVVDQIIIGAITGGVGGVGQTALQAQTWRDGLAAGIGESLLGGLRGSLSGAATAAVTNVVEAMPVGRGALAAMRAGGEYRSLGDSISRLGTGTGAFRVAAGVAGRSTARAGLQALGGVAGRSTELAFDSARGRYSGSLTQALDQIGEAGVHAGLQGAFEGGAEAFGQRRRDVAHPEEAQHREEERMRQIAAESELMRRGVHAQAEAAS
ncbi:MAG TPA: hypothetical protein VFS42_03955, partial [Burkholderiaceae bacterium]|nr:hypothetical protein [Burkholderiaceae bacterium]